MMDIHNRIKKGVKVITLLIFCAITACTSKNQKISYQRECISINKNWKFFKYKFGSDTLIYDIRPDVKEYNDNKVADSKPTEAEEITQTQFVLKPWILPTGNNFIKDETKRFIKPSGNPGGDFDFVSGNYNDSTWENLDLPHDWAIAGPFCEGWGAEVGGGMGRLPSHGVAWYRKKIEIQESDNGKSIFLQVDGAMSYAVVWCNGKLVGGWPYGYASFQLDLTPYVNFGGQNQLAIRLDNPPNSSRWYTGGGIYRDMWLIKTNSIHVSQWGTFVKATNVSSKEATINIDISIDNHSKKDVTVNTVTNFVVLDELGNVTSKLKETIETTDITILSNESSNVSGKVTISKPKLWGPLPNQKPNRYEAITRVYVNQQEVDTYKTQFGIRSVEFDANSGLMVNGEKIKIQGVNQHHDLGALGAAFNKSAAERQLMMLKELGCNAIRLAHNPPAPELLQLTDSLGFLVIDEIFDVWERKKTPLDFHLIFPDWYEQDTRAFIRRDRNHPSIIAWSFGNEVGEQYTGEDGAKIAERLHNIASDEDPTRPSTASMNFAKPDMPFPAQMDIISLNYQGEGIRNAPAYKDLKGIHTEPLYNAFHNKFPDKMIFSSETASALSTRGTYIFPVSTGISAPVRNGAGGDDEHFYVSSYELYTADFGSSADKVFQSQDKHPFVAGEFVWSGWDYIGEPTPYYLARSSYSGIIDLAGFKKDRFYLYQSRWRPELPMVHILPHWNWSDRIGKTTPVHVFTSGDEVELFLNERSLGRKKKQAYEYRLRWDDVVYEPGELKAIAYKNGKKWKEEIIKTTGEPAKLEFETINDKISVHNKELSFITVMVTDQNGIVVPDAHNHIRFHIEGPGEIVATDNGNPADMTPFISTDRNVFNGYGLVIIKGTSLCTGDIKLIAESDNLESTEIIIKLNP